MKLFACKDENEWVARADEWLNEQSRRFRNSQSIRLFVPAGETPRPLYRSWRKNPSRLDSRLRFIQVDEVLANGMFRRFFCDELPTFQSRFEFIEDASGGGDLAFLGLGLNGHVAFHEPSLPRQFYSGCLKLDSETCSRLKLPAGSRAVSYGVDAFLKTRAIALLVRGPQKKSILQDVLERRRPLPASWLLDHPDLTVFTDFEID